RQILPSSLGTGGGAIPRWQARSRAIRNDIRCPFTDVTTREENSGHRMWTSWLGSHAKRSIACRVMSRKQVFHMIESWYSRKECSRELHWRCSSVHTLQQLSTQRF